MTNNKLKIAMFERRDVVKQNIDMLVNKAEDIIVDRFLVNSESKDIPVKLDKVVKGTEITEAQLRDNIDILQNVLVDRGYVVKHAWEEISEDLDVLYLVVSV